ncbi:hypothetical protein RJ55_00744 [Drechmeria coniospora]|nr:hypothetical protein RJ55_00744 [Drechmeria coniospora]
MATQVSKSLRRALTTQFGQDERPVFPDELFEIKLLEEHGPELVALLQDEVTLIDLGAGDTRKVEHLLSVFESVQKPATYLALDISKASIQHNVAYLVEKHPAASSTVKCAGLWGTFQDGKKQVEKIKTPRLFLSLGSVLCNDPWPRALEHLQYWVDAMVPGDLLLVGMDGHTLPDDEEKIWNSYHEGHDLYHKFFLNGLEHANRLLGEKCFKEHDWEFGAELGVDGKATRHRFILRAKNEVKIGAHDRVIKQGEEFDWFDSHKYTEQDVTLMCSQAGLAVLKVWQAPQSNFRQYLLTLKGKND